MLLPSTVCYRRLIDAVILSVWLMTAAISSSVREMKKSGVIAFTAAVVLIGQRVRQYDGVGLRMGQVERATERVTTLCAASGPWRTVLGRSHALRRDGPGPRRISSVTLFSERGDYAARNRTIAQLLIRFVDPRDVDLLRYQVIKIQPSLHVEFGVHRDVAPNVG